MKNIFLTSCGIINDKIKNEFYEQINKDIKDGKAYIKNDKIAVDIYVTGEIDLDNIHRRI